MDESTAKSIARAVHEVNRAYCLAIGEDRPLPHWEDAPEAQRASAIAGVPHGLNPARLPAESHESWMALKIADGWVFGEKVDYEAKTHPCLVEYDQLPATQRAKDALFLAVVRAFAAALESK